LDDRGLAIQNNALRQEASLYASTGVALFVITKEPKGKQTTHKTTETQRRESLAGDRQSANALMR